MYDMIRFYIQTYCKLIIPGIFQHIYHLQSYLWHGIHWYGRYHTKKLWHLSDLGQWLGGLQDCLGWLVQGIRHLRRQVFSLNFSFGSNKWCWCGWWMMNCRRYLRHLWNMKWLNLGESNTIWLRIGAASGEGKKWVTIQRWAGSGLQEHIFKFRMSKCSDWPQTKKHHFLVIWIIQLSRLQVQWYLHSACIYKGFVCFVHVVLGWP